ncbi:MAG: hypothetical protein J6K16_05820 [Alphaproteobacteria bacterium]|nr:hypothetical protein [Alphaproteobacteria bacterium]
MYKKMNLAVKEIFETTVKGLAQKDVLFVMPAFYPQRGGILEDVVACGGKAIIAGGAPKQQLFDGIVQYSPGFDTTGISETPKEIYEIVKAIPNDVVRGKDVALFIEAPVGRHWSNNLKLKKANIVLSNEQNLRSFFEEKVNLEKVLKTADLKDCFIPSEVVISENLSHKDMYDLYAKYCGENGKVVLQSCGAENVESGGGKGTDIVADFDEFCDVIVQHHGHVKVAKFIDGYCSNMSMFVGNMIADKENGGMIKGGLKDGDDAFNPQTLNVLLNRGENMGISDDNVVVLAARASLKAIGDKNLTKSSSNGVGNSLGYEFAPEINDKINEIAQKLGALMGKCGKVGLAGADLIIDKNNHIWINEINDRQQGPTEQLSLDAENSDLVGIHRLAFVANYADCSQPKVQKLFYQIKQVSPKIYEQSLQSDGSFYIKMMGKQAGVASSIIDLQPGIYAVHKTEGGKWNWDFSQKYQEAPNVNLNNDTIYLGLAGVSLKKGQSVPSGAQILRIVGKAKNGSSPFNISDGKVAVNPKWLPIIKDLYGSIFGKDYNKQFEQQMSAFPCQKSGWEK